MRSKSVLLCVVGGLSLATSAMAQVPRVSATQKGSLLMFSKVDIKWDASGNLVKDTILDISNDADDGSVDVQAYFINGDLIVEEEYDNDGNIIQGFEPGWNTADCRFELTKSQPHFWSAAKGSDKCQPFSVLDMDGPGRTDSDGNQILRGMVIMWAVKFDENRVVSSVETGEVEYPNGAWREIRWNDLKGDALIIDYKNGAAEEYNVWAFQAHGVPHGAFLPGPGTLKLDGREYDSTFGQMMLDFYASGSTALSTTGISVSIDTELTLNTMYIDVRQDGVGPFLTKIEAEIFNENESKFSGTRRCTCCYDSTLLSNWVRTVAVPNHFLRSKLGTDKGAARLDGVKSTDCDYRDICGTSCSRGMHELAQKFGHPGLLSFDVPVLGVASKHITFTGGATNVETAAMSLVGIEEEAGGIGYDLAGGSGELNR